MSNNKCKQILFLANFNIQKDSITWPQKQFIDKLVTHKRQKQQQKVRRKPVKYKFI